MPTSRSVGGGGGRRRRLTRLVFAMMVAWLVALLPPPAVEARTPFVANLDRWTFDKVARAGRWLVVKFDIEFPHGAFNTAFQKFAAHVGNSGQQTPWIVGEVRSKETDSFHNRDVFERFGLKPEDFPAVFALIPRRQREGVRSPPPCNDGSAPCAADDKDEELWEGLAIEVRPVNASVRPLAHHRAVVFRGGAHDGAFDPHRAIRHLNALWMRCGQQQELESRATTPTSSVRALLERGAVIAPPDVTSDECAAWSDDGEAHDNATARGNDIDAILAAQVKEYGRGGKSWLTVDDGTSAGLYAGGAHPKAQRVYSPPRDAEDEYREFGAEPKPADPSPRADDHAKQQELIARKKQRMLLRWKENLRATLLQRRRAADAVIDRLDAPAASSSCSGDAEVVESSCGAAPIEVPRPPGDEVATFARQREELLASRLLPDDMRQMLEFQLSLLWCARWSVFQ